MRFCDVKRVFGNAKSEASNEKPSASDAKLKGAMKKRKMPM